MKNGVMGAVCSDLKVVSYLSQMPYCPWLGRVVRPRMVLWIDPHRMQSRLTRTPRIRMGIVANVQDLVGV